jgi:3-hydroxyisobutyrate dehydrogenase-like beta-hydroxyacid dehydrogenase
MIEKRRAVIFKSAHGPTINSLEGVFNGMADLHFDLGKFGNATKMKIIANMMVCIHNLEAAEAINLGVKAGLDPQQMLRVLGPSAAGSSTFTNKAPLMLERRFASGPGPFSHMFRCLERAESLAADLQVATPLLESARQVYSLAEAERRHDQDIAAIVEIVEARARRVAREEL